MAREEEAANRLPDFVAYVDMIMDIMRRELTDHGRKPNAIAPVQPNVTQDVPTVARKRRSKEPTKMPEKQSHGSAKASKGKRR